MRHASGTALTTTFGTATTQQPDLLLQANIAIGVTSSNVFSLTSGWSNLETAADYTDGGATGFSAASQVMPVTSTGTFATAIGFSGTATTEFDSIMVALKGVTSGAVPTNLFFF
jgi:hypothetical protein